MTSRMICSSLSSKMPTRYFYPYLSVIGSGLLSLADLGLLQLGKELVPARQHFDGNSTIPVVLVPRDLQTLRGGHRRGMMRRCWSGARAQACRRIWAGAQHRPSALSGAGPRCSTWSSRPPSHSQWPPAGIPAALFMPFFTCSVQILLPLHVIDLLMLI